jgi:putative flippase GtrA
VHYGVLKFNLTVIGISSAGIANLIAACFGISTSFLGNRYFVFQSNDPKILSQALKFSGLYGAIALLHGFILFVWSDWFGLDYRIGFLIATFFQFVLSYIGNKKMVFKG